MCVCVCVCVRAACVRVCELTATKIAPGPCRVSSQPYSQMPLINASNKLLIIYPKTRFAPKTWFRAMATKSVPPTHRERFFVSCSYNAGSEN